MFKLKKGDRVTVIAGKDKGKTGRVMEVFPKENRCLVERLNLVKRHLRRAKANEQSGIIERESPISMSNLMLFCSKCNRSARVGFRLLQDGSKVRACKKCKEII